VLFNEPKLLKNINKRDAGVVTAGFSALQRAEIAENDRVVFGLAVEENGFSALQRAEIAENLRRATRQRRRRRVSVLFNEPKLLKIGVCLV